MITKDSIELYLYQANKSIFQLYDLTSPFSVILYAHFASFATIHQPFCENNKHLYLIM